MWWDGKRKGDQAILCNNHSMILVSCIIHILCLWCLQAHDFEHAYEALEKVLRVRGFDLIWELDMTCEADEKSVFSHRFQMNLQYIVCILSKSGEPCLGYQMLLVGILSRNAAVLLKPWISVGQLLPRLELNQIVWTMIATARLFLRQQWTTAQMWDAQKKGRAMVSSDQNPSQLVYVVEITQFYGVWNILMWIWIWNVRHKWRHP